MMYNTSLQSAYTEWVTKHDRVSRKKHIPCFWQTLLMGRCVCNLCADAAMRRKPSCRKEHMLANIIYIYIYICVYICIYIYSYR